MNRQTSRTQNTLPALSIALGLATGIFILDWITPRGMAPQMLYAVAILISVWTYNQRIVKLLAWLCTVLTVAGFIHGSGDPSEISIFNRVVSIGLVWLTAVLALLYMRTEERLRQVNLNLEELVTERTEALLYAVEQRERLGRDLHDDVLQLLYAAGLNLKTAVPPLKTCPPDVAGQVRHTISELELAMQHLRDYIAGPQPTADGEPPVGVALASLVQSMAVAGRPQFNLNLQPGLSAVLLSRTKTEHVVHIVREALSNCARHSQATQGLVTALRDNGMLKIEISDDGIGFTPNDAKQGGHGLANMAARAREIGGQLTVVSSPGQGTQIVVQVPWLERVRP
jgi:two-component system, NarL family, sensor histidine kinase DevS